jgi:UDPglucose 6-dehydrogenase
VTGVHLFLLGAGHVGLVTAVGLARLDHRVTVADVAVDRIEALRGGRAPIYEPGLEDAIRELGDRGLLAFTTDVRPPGDASMTFVCVNTPTGPEGPLSTTNVERAVAAVLDAAGPDHVVVVRSTLPLEGPGRLAALVADRDERPSIVTNPEFMREGSALLDFERPSRVITGWLEPRDRAAAEEVAALYAPLGAPTLVADAASVALIKLASNVLLAAKVAFGNELARLSEAIGADALLVADGVGMDTRIGRSFLTAGPGYGGSCLPEQALGLAQMAAARSVPSPLIDAVSRSNTEHQRAIVDRIAALLDGGLEGRRIALLGLAFKANTDDVRESPALALAALLRGRGARVVGYDPRAGARARVADPEIEVAETVAGALDGADAAVVATEWGEFADLDWETLARCLRGTLVYDARNVLDGDRVARSGLRYAALGRS